MEDWEVLFWMFIGLAAGIIFTLAFVLRFTGADSLVQLIGR